MFTRDRVLALAKTCALYLAAGYYLAQAVGILQPMLTAPEPPAEKPRPRPCPCTARRATGAHAAEETPDDAA